MRPFPMRLRLTLWYGALLSAGLLGFSLFMVATLRHAMRHTVDRQLLDHMAAIRTIVAEDENQREAALQHDLDEDVELAPDLTLLEIWDDSGRAVYRSAAMNRMQVPEGVPQVTQSPQTRPSRRHPLRVLVRRVATPSHNYVVLVAIPIHDFLDAIDQVVRTLWIAVPVLLLLAVAGGYWIASRALAPVRGMIAAANSIHPGDISTRLKLPAADDELRQLALTLNRMLDRLQAGFERVTRFTADASHELRTPIALLRTRTELLLRRERAPQEYRSALEQNLDELEKTSGLLEELMVLARADAGAESLHFTSLDFALLVRDVAAIMQPLAQAKQLAWLVSVPESPVILHGDETSLRRLLLVLLDNAVKYTAAQGAIEIVLRTHEKQATLEVRDTGIGISEHDMPHIFERFYRADRARTRTAGGAGLGLSIGKWIVQQHGGTMTAQSSLMQGSVFYVTLPTSLPSAETVSSSRETAAGHSVEI